MAVGASGRSRRWLHDKAQTRTTMAVDGSRANGLELATGDDAVRKVEVNDEPLQYVACRLAGWANDGKLAHE
jgi:hypothetical protein